MHLTKAVLISVPLMIAGTGLMAAPHSGKHERTQMSGHAVMGHGERVAQSHGAKGCPPGLAKKSPNCMPPGQAKKYGPGEVIPQGSGVVISSHDRHGLPPAPQGQVYIEVGRDIYLMAEATQKVIEAVNILKTIN